MPYTRDGAAEFSTHDVKSPLLNPQAACGQCHTDTDVVIQRVKVIQDNTRLTMDHAEDTLVAAIVQTLAYKQGRTRRFAPTVLTRSYPSAPGFAPTPAQSGLHPLPACGSSPGRLPSAPGWQRACYTG